MATLTGFLKDNEGVYIPKDAASVLTYTLDWSDWLPTGSTITTNTYTVETITGDAAPLVKSAQSNTNTTTTIKVSAGTAGNIYKVFNTIITSGGLTDKRYFRIKVETRSL
jgi:hypothetical protein